MYTLPGDVVSLASRHIGWRRRLPMAVPCFWRNSRSPNSNRFSVMQSFSASMMNSMGNPGSGRFSLVSHFRIVAIPCSVSMLQYMETASNEKIRSPGSKPFGKVDCRAVRRLSESLM